MVTGMTNLEVAAQELELGAEPAKGREPMLRADDFGAPVPPVAPAPVQIVEAREVPLGGLRAMTVHRTIPHRSRSMIGAWCFADRYGPNDVSNCEGMQVAPHPHTGLQTVTWLFAGEVLHRDSLGNTQIVRPGELNLMTAGRGIAHSEQSPEQRPRVLHGVQLWTALPSKYRNIAPTFEHFSDSQLPVVDLGNARAFVMLGSLGGVTSPATAYSPIVGAEVLVPNGGEVVLEVDPAFEHGILVDTVALNVEGAAVGVSDLAYLPVGRRRIRVETPGPARFLLIGGEPFEEQIVMWWNFVGGSHEDVVAARGQWMAEISGAEGAGRFGTVAGYDGEPWPAPPVPNVRLRARG